MLCGGNVIFCVIILYLFFAILSLKKTWFILTVGIMHISIIILKDSLSVKHFEVQDRDGTDRLTAYTKLVY